MTWKRFARCRGMDRELFFSEFRHDTNEAVRFCKECPVRTICLEMALRYGERGVWGGTTEVQRRNMRRYEFVGSSRCP